MPFSHALLTINSRIFLKHYAAWNMLFPSVVHLPLLKMSCRRHTVINFQFHYKRYWLWNGDGNFLWFFCDSLSQFLKNNNLIFNNEISKVFSKVLLLESESKCVPWELSSQDSALCWTANVYGDLHCVNHVSVFFFLHSNSGRNEKEIKVKGEHCL